MSNQQTDLVFEFRGHPWINFVAYSYGLSLYYFLKCTLTSSRRAVLDSAR
jgi:hypothetical protein